jgi:hypothetical protein
MFTPFDVGYEHGAAIKRMLGVVVAVDEPHAYSNILCAERITFIYIYIYIYII